MFLSIPGYRDRNELIVKCCDHIAARLTRLESLCCTILVSYATSQYLGFEMIYHRYYHENHYFITINMVVDVEKAIIPSQEEPV